MEQKPKGPRPKYGQKMRRVCVTLDDETIAKAKRLGGGNLAEGLRRAVIPRRVAVPASPKTSDALSPDSEQPESLPV